MLAKIRLVEEISLSVQVAVVICSPGPADNKDTDFSAHYNSVDHRSFYVLSVPAGWNILAFLCVSSRVAVRLELVATQLETPRNSEASKRSSRAACSSKMRSIMTQNGKKRDPSSSVFDLIVTDSFLCHTREQFYTGKGGAGRDWRTSKGHRLV